MPVVWVIGDSFVHWMSQTAARCGDEACIRGFEVRYFGRRGLCLSQFNNFLHETWAAANQTPDVCIIHVGSNDLGRLPKKVILENIQSILGCTRQVLPNAVLFWSGILPRIHYMGAHNQSKVERTRRAINRIVGGLFRAAPGG